MEPSEGCRITGTLSSSKCIPQRRQHGFRLEYPSSNLHRVLLPIPYNLPRIRVSYQQVIQTNPPRLIVPLQHWYSSAEGGVDNGRKLLLRHPNLHSVLSPYPVLVLPPSGSALEQLSPLPLPLRLQDFPVPSPVVLPLSRFLLGPVLRLRLRFLLVA